jgi:hypothetical protein
MVRSVSIRIKKSDVGFNLLDPLKGAWYKGASILNEPINSLFT